MSEQVVTIDEAEMVDNLACIYDVIETHEGRQSIIEQCIHGGIPSKIAQGVLVYLQMCEYTPADLVEALNFAATNIDVTSN